MIKSKITIKNNNPCLCIGEEEFPACAYITYFDERNNYSDFAKAGFRIFSVSVSLAKQPINTASGFTPFCGGVFDKKGEADYSAFDDTIEKVLEACPDAYIFPRIYVCMPEWWITENPTEAIPVPNGKYREALYSERFRTDAAEMLKALIEHIKKSPFADRIFGYQISGGNTQEWFHLDLNGGYHKNALPYFNAYLKKKNLYADDLPPLDEIGGAEVKNPLLQEYIRFANESVADTVEYLCRAAKEAVDYQQIIGVFYGYTAEVADPLWGTHALGKLLNSENINFFSSPNSYIKSRALGTCWADMMPADSIRLHGKMCFIECDIRTFLTKSPENSRKGSDPLHYYSDDVWRGPETEELSVWAVKKSLARQLTHRNGLWWFDMFGHWFASERLMKEMRLSMELYKRGLNDTGTAPDAEVAVFLDEQMYTYIGKKHPLFAAPYNARAVLGSCGAPYHMYLIEDFEKLCISRYKAFIFIIPEKSAALSAAIAKLGRENLPFICYTKDKNTYSANELREFIRKSGAFIYCESNDVFYIGNGYAALHAASGGSKEIRLPEKLRCTDTESGQELVTDCLRFECAQFETRLFRLDSV